MQGSFVCSGRCFSLFEQLVSAHLTLQIRCHHGCSTVRAYVHQVHPVGFIQSNMGKCMIYDVVGMAKLGVNDDASCIITHVHQPCLLYDLQVTITRPYLCANHLAAPYIGPAASAADAPSAAPAPQSAAGGAGEGYGAGTARPL